MNNRCDECANDGACDGQDMLGFGTTVHCPAFEPANPPEKDPVYEVMKRDTALRLIEQLLKHLGPCRLGEPLVEPYEWTDGFYGSYKQYPGVNMPQKCQSCEHSYKDRCFVDAPLVDDKIEWDNVRGINLKHPCLRYSPKGEMLPCDW